MGTEPEKVAYTDTQMVYLASVPALNQLLQGVYSQLKTKLRLGNIPQAANLFDPYISEKYAKIFTTIKHLPSMANNLGAIEEGTITDEFAEYMLFRQKNGTRYAYPLYFTHGKDGIWRISGM